MNLYCATTGSSSRNLLIPAVISLAVGIGWTRLFPLPSELVNTIAIAAIACCLLYCRRLKTSFAGNINYILLIFFFLLIGMLHAAESDKTPSNPDHIVHLIQNQQEGTILGRLRQTARTGTDKYRLFVDAEQLILPNQTIPASGQVQLTSKTQPPIDLIPGDRLLVRATLDRPHSFNTPGAFNYQRYLADQSIWITGFIRSPAHILKIHERSPASLIDTIRYLPEQIRHRISIDMDPMLDDKIRGLYKAILIGERGDITPEQNEDFNSSGLTHLLSISGMHLSMLAFLVIILVSWLLKRSSYLLLHTNAIKLAALLSFPILTGYTLITALDPPVLRSFCMVSVFLLAILIDRQNSVPTNTSLAAFLLLLWQPTSLFNVSFQLTFAAVIAIILALPFAEALTQTTEITPPHPLRKLQQFLMASILISVAAQLGTAPLTIFHFNRFSLISPITTLLTAPLACYWSLPIGLIAILLLPIAPSLSAQLFSLGAWGMAATAEIAHFAGQLSFSSIWLPTPSILEVIAWYVFLFSLLGWKKRMFFRVSAIASLIIAVTIPLSVINARKQTATTTVTYLDVGQGSATLLELPHDRTILIDGGGPFSERFNIGQSVIAPLLWSKKITRLDAIVLTHFHADHYSGLPFILAAFKPQTLWLNNMPPAEPILDQLMKIADDNNIRRAIPNKNDFLFNDDHQVSLQVVSDLHTDNSLQTTETPTSPKKKEKANEASLVLKLRHGKKSFLFPGDIEMEEEQLLLKKEVDLNADVLLAPHHGRASSSSEEFIKTVSPSYVVISASSYGKSQRLTNYKTQKYQEAGCTVFSTGENGAITFYTDGDTLSSPELF